MKNGDAIWRPEDYYGRIFHNRTGEVTFVPLLNGKMAQECPGYITHILRNYENLPDVSIFLHANPYAHQNHHILKDVRFILDNWSTKEIGFLHLNNEFIDRVPRGEQWPSLWRLLGFDPKDIPENVQLSCCAQFMVTRERILLRSRWFYEQLLKITYESQKCAFQEHYWHIFFGEDPILPHERYVGHHRTYDDSGVASWSFPGPARLRSPIPNFPCSKSMLTFYQQPNGSEKYSSDLCNKRVERE